MSDGVFEVSRVVRFITCAERVGDERPEFVYFTVGDDKYAPDEHVQIDCADRLALCHAACCRLRVPLSRQDIAENVTQWDRREPYLNRQRADGYCVHCDESSHACDIYPHRPGLCRSFDCRADDRIWVDFERRVPNPDLAKHWAALESPALSATVRLGLRTERRRDEFAGAHATDAVGNA